MPIRPENKHRYPKDWKQIRERILERAQNRCEFCGEQNYAIVERYSNSKNGTKVKSVKIILTIAHLDHTPENNAPENLRALCQKCHNKYDAPMRAAGRKERKKCKW